MASFYNVSFITLEKAFEKLDKKYIECLNKNDMRGYIITLDSFLNLDFNKEKLSNLKPYQYTIEVRSSVQLLRLDIYNNPKEESTYISDEEIKKLQELYAYLKEPEVAAYLKNSEKLFRRFIMPLFLSVPVIFIILVLKVKGII